MEIRLPEAQEIHIRRYTSLQYAETIVSRNFKYKGFVLQKTVNGLKHANILNTDLSLVSILIRHVDVTANAKIIVILTSFSLVALTQVLLPNVITPKVSEHLTATLRAKT